MTTRPTKSRERQATDATPLLLGIESGATRTVAIAAGGDLAEPVRHEFGPANLQMLDDRQLALRLKAIARSMPHPDSLAIGMAGARTDADHARLRRAAETVWPGVPCHATSDLETCLVAVDGASPPGRRAVAARARASAGGGPDALPRVLIVSGTGSCCFARGADGRTARLGGWGHLLGDSGSGYDIALTAARAVIHANDYDRRWPELGQRFLRALVLNEPEDLVNWAQSAGKDDIAALAVEVFAASEDGDPIAEEVLEFAARSLASDGFACARLVAKPGTPVQFVLAGSVLLRQPRFAGRVRRALLQLWPAALVSPLRGDSAWGAVELARQNVGAAAPRTRPRRQAADPGPAAAAVPPLQSLSKSPTERRHPRSTNLDRLPVESAVELMLQEDKRIPPALLARREEIARGVALIARAFKRGGRLFYVGAGTSGRLGVLDASECPPTFRTPPDMVQGVIAGGTRALWSAVEGAEDDAEAGSRAVASRGVVRQDVVVGIAASGRTPFVWGALGEARRRGASTVLLCFNPHVAIPRGQRPTLVIAPDVGPEILTGSTRLKAGTATKLVLNVFTTLAMVQVGKVRSNLMVDVNASNIKLRDRAVRILQELTGADYERARQALEKTRWKVPEAMAALEATRGR